MRLPGVLAAFALTLCQSAAAKGQLVSLADDIIVISKGLSNQQSARSTTALGHVPGSNAAPFQYDPGGRGNRLEESGEPARSHARVGGGHPSALSAASLSTSMLSTSASAQHGAKRLQRFALRQPQAIQQRVPPLYGLLEIPTAEYQGPPGAMTLDQAIERLLRDSPDLRSKRYEIPQARADVLTAGQRANPLYFLSASNYPYQPYSRARPGSVEYSTSIVQPFDVNHKRLARMDAADRALRVLEAQYQNAVRLAIDDLYQTFTDVVVARETLRYAEVSSAGATTLFEASQRPDAAPLSESDRLNLAIQYETARLGVDQARRESLRAKQHLAVILAIPREQAAQIEIRGLLRPPENPPPPREVLVQMALDNRPDVVAFRLGISRAQADAQVARKERFEDIFVIYSPYQFQNNGPIGGQNATSFSFGRMGSIPLFDRNQGEIRRADLNVAQTRAALATIERQAVADVENALMEYEASREAVERIEKIILPASERARVIAYQEHEAGRTSTVEYLLALRDRNEIVRQYRDALVRHRRSMLQLNTAVGRRLLP